MKKLLLIATTLCLFTSNISIAQYTLLTDFGGNGSVIGPNSPGWDQNFITDDTYLYGMTNKGGSGDFGTVFKIKISDNTYIKIMDFTGTANGRNPYGSLISDGTYLYGMTLYGGANEMGTVFKIKISDNSYSTLLNFTGAATGSYPLGSLFNDGTYLYGMTFQGGTNSNGVVFKIKISDNSFTKILDFTGAANGNYPKGSLISDGTFLYGMTTGGGSGGKGTAFKIKISDNSYTKILDFTGTANGSEPYGSLISDGFYLYGMTRQGGTNNSGTAFKINISDNTYTKILDFTGAEGGSEPYGSLISDGTYLYGLTAYGGTSNFGTAFKIKLSDNTFTRIFDFTADANGVNPYGSLTSDGTFLYGMTNKGGSYALGAAFKINISDNSYTKVLDFAGGTNGRYPTGSLISDGTYLYGLAAYGGTNTLGTAFKIKISDNTFTRLLDFTGTANGSNPRGSFISDGIYLYGMTSTAQIIFVQYLKLK
jgi:uncharacterized repeat protein (TIGR03803 family)